MNELNRVVITGMGVVSPIGNNLNEVKNSLFENKSGIVFSPKYQEMGFRSQVHGDLDIDIKDLADQNAYRVLVKIRIKELDTDDQVEIVLRRLR